MGDGRTAAAAVAALVFNAFVWGVSWWPFRQLHAQGLHPLWSTALIYLFSLGCLWAWKPAAWRAGWRHPLFWLLMAASGMTNLGFNWGVTVGDVVRVVLLFYLMPGWTLLLAWPLLGERPDAAGLLRLALALTGVALVLGDGQAGWPLPRSLPDWLGLVGGFSFSLTNILLRKLDRIPAETRVLAMFGGGAITAATVAAVGAAQGAWPLPPAPGLDWLPLAALVGVAFLLGNLALQFGASRLAAHTTALVMLSEVVFASLSAAWLGSTRLNGTVLMGGALILAAAAWSAWPARPRRAPAAAQ